MAEDTVVNSNTPAGNAAANNSANTEVKTGEAPTVPVPVQTNEGPLPLTPDAPTVKQAAGFTIEIPFDPQLTNASEIQNIIRRALNNVSEVFNIVEHEVKDWKNKADKLLNSDAKGEGPEVKDKK